MSSTVQPRGPGYLPVLFLAAVPLGTFRYDGPRLAPAGGLLVGLARWLSWAFWLTATLASLVVAQPLGWLLLGFFVLSVHPRRILVARVGFSPRLRDSALVLWRLGGRWLVAATAATAVAAPVVTLLDASWDVALALQAGAVIVLLVLSTVSAWRYADRARNALGIAGPE
ncbi:hypothetical protein [Kocuria sp. BT304]|uniref:hypothetical protein n=1 Tax=Kocuria sp. BT304 TaxID=1702043 RepID=UPI000DD4A88E|nr:hypothetical protein [Kocuria sp. BT304]